MTLINLNLVSLFLRLLGVIGVPRFLKIVKFGKMDARHVGLKMERLECARWFNVSILSVYHTVHNMLIQ